MIAKITTCITAIFLFVACSKSSSGGSTTPPPPDSTCNNKSDCIVGTWNIQSFNAKLKDGTSVPLYTAGSSSNLLNPFYWQFIKDGIWKEYEIIGSNSSLQDSGAYNIAADDTLYLKGAIPQTFIISDINKSSMAGYTVYSHLHPDSLSTILAKGAGIDTANFDGTTMRWTR